MPIKQYFEPYFASKLNNFADLTEDEVTDAIIFFVDYIEHAFHNDQSYIFDVSQKTLRVFDHFENLSRSDENEGEFPLVKQSCMYSFSIYAQHISQQAFSPLLPHLLKQIQQMVENSAAYSDDNIVSTEQAISTLLRLVIQHREDKMIND